MLAPGVGGPFSAPKKMITIVDYGLGNVRAFCNTYQRLGIDLAVGKTGQDLSKATKLILPGVGAFDWAMSRLNESGMRERLDELVVQLGVPVLGVCVGMQMMADASEEGKLAGLGWIGGQVKRLARTLEDVSNSVPMQLPHMGWNTAREVKSAGLFESLSESRFYFLHSYHFIPREADSILAVTDYIDQFVSSVGKGNIYGVQFHPEKSHLAGIQLLKNFAEL